MIDVVAWTDSERAWLTIAAPQEGTHALCLMDDHQAAMREAGQAAMELATAIRSGITDEEGGYTYFTKRGMSHVETKIAELLRVLSAHQECGGGGLE